MRKPDALLFTMLFVIGTACSPTMAISEAGTSSEKPQPKLTEGKLLPRVAPAYAPIVRAARIQGTVVPQAVIGKDGLLNSIMVVSGPPMLQQAAIDYVKQWKYQPYLLGGEPVEVKTTLSIAFTMGPGEEAPFQQNQATTQATPEPQRAQSGTAPASALEAARAEMAKGDNGSAKTLKAVSVASA